MKGNIRKYENLGGVAKAQAVFPENPFIFSRRAE